jgi:hypothetical protein
MTNMQRLVLVLAFIFAVLLGVLVATNLLGGKGGSSTPTASPSGSAAVASLPAPSSAPASASPSASASASPSPTPTPTPGPTASISFVQLGLDAATDGNGTTRAISLVAQNGTVTVKVTTESGGNSQVCLVADGEQLACHTGVSSSLTSVNQKATSNFQITLRGDANATPVVDVTIAFPATKPKVTIRNARFDGTDAPVTNGLQVVTTPRANGSYHVGADWGGHPFQYELDLIEQGGPGLKTMKPATGATKLSQGFAVVPPHGWMIVLKNTESGFGATPLTATFTWP